MPRGKRDKDPVKVNTFREVPCIIGIDQSYTRTGISICVRGKLKKVSSINFGGTTTHYMKSKTAKRLEVQRVVKKAIESCLKKFKPEEIVIIAERIRTYTASTSLRPLVIKAQSAMMAYIVDTAYVYGIKVYSVDTRAWKTRVLGTADPIAEPFPGVKNPQKVLSVKKIISLGFEESLSIYSYKTNSISYDDDAADSACIALYGFSGYPYHLQLEM